MMVINCNQEYHLSSVVHGHHVCKHICMAPFIVKRLELKYENCNGQNARAVAILKGSMIVSAHHKISRELCNSFLDEAVLAVHAGRSPKHSVTKMEGDRLLSRGAVVALCGIVILVA